MGSNAYNNAEEAIFAEMMQRMAAVEGQRAIEENERLKADPTFVVPDETHKKMMDLLGGCMKTKLEEAYASVGKGWHGLLNKYLPQIYAIDPDCELVVKEKYGTLRIQPYKVSEGVSRNKINAIANRAEKESEKVCESCGAPGYPHLDGFWIVTLCDECFMGGRSTPIEEFPEDGLHPETENVINEYLENKELE